MPLLSLRLSSQPPYDTCRHFTPPLRTYYADITYFSHDSDIVVWLLRHAIAAATLRRAAGHVMSHRLLKSAAFATITLPAFICMPPYRCCRHASESRFIIA